MVQSLKTNCYVVLHWQRCRWRSTWVWHGFITMKKCSRVEFGVNQWWCQSRDSLLRLFRKVVMEVVMAAVYRKGWKRSEHKIVCLSPLLSFPSTPLWLASFPINRRRGWSWCVTSVEWLSCQCSTSDSNPSQSLLSGSLRNFNRILPLSSASSRTPFCPGLASPHPKWERCKFDLIITESPRWYFLRFGILSTWERKTSDIRETAKDR